MTVWLTTVHNRSLKDFRRQSSNDHRGDNLYPRTVSSRSAPATVLLIRYRWQGLRNRDTLGPSPHRHTGGDPWRTRCMKTGGSSASSPGERNRSNLGNSWERGGAALGGHDRPPGGGH